MLNVRLVTICLPFINFAVDYGLLLRLQPSTYHQQNTFVRRYGYRK